MGFGCHTQSAENRSYEVRVFRWRQSRYQQLFLDIDGGRDGEGVEVEDGAVDSINSKGGNSGRDGVIYEGNPFAHIPATDAVVFGRTSVEVWSWAQFFRLAWSGSSTIEG